MCVDMPLLPNWHVGMVANYRRALNVSCNVYAKLQPELASLSRYR